MKADQIALSTEVRNALDGSLPVVALESTIIAHGMPYPKNLGTALEVETIIRDLGAVPATIGILNGVMHCGMSQEELGVLATSPDVMKAGERDIPLAVSRGRHAATTVSASLAVASAVGIRVFVTGGIGGVGTDAGRTFDISSDLQAIAQYPCVTLCAGAKAFMDVAATLEYLETHRVVVASYQSETFPFFYSRDSGQRVEWVVQDVDEIADVFLCKLRLGLGGGMVVGVPVPAKDALPEEETHRAIEAGLAKLRESGASGKAVTPLLLKAIVEQTQGRSLAANIALVKNNAAVGARLAVCLSEAIRNRTV